MAAGSAEPAESLEARQILVDHQHDLAPGRRCNASRTASTRARRGERRHGSQNRLAAMLISIASTVVLKRYARMQCREPMRRMRLVVKDTSAV
jgi:hypothetical protein